MEPIREEQLNEGLQRFRERLRAARLACGLSMEDLAKRCWLHQPNISNYENGHHVPTMGIVSTLAAGMGTTPAALLGGGTGRVAVDFRQNLRHLIGDTPHVEVAERCRLDPAYIRRMCLQDTNPTVGTVLRLAHALGVEPWEVISQ